VNNYPTAVQTLNDLKKGSKFRNFLVNAEKLPVMNGYRLIDLIIMPVQRIPRYKMLLEKLLEETPVDHIDYPILEEARTKMTKLAEYVNEKKREAENLEQVLKVQDRLSGSVPVFIFHFSFLIFFFSNWQSLIGDIFMREIWGIL